MIYKYFYSACFILLLPSSSRASLFIEPYVGLAKQEVHFSDQADIADGFALGAKIGLFVNQKIYVGADYLQGGPYKFSSDLSDSELTNTMMGAGIGADYKIIRFWAGYYFDNEFVVAQSSLKFIGTAIKFGFGLLASKKFRANLDLIYHKMTEAESTSVFSSYSGSIEDIDFVTTMVSVSFPIDLK